MLEFTVHKRLALPKEVQARRVLVILKSLKRCFDAVAPAYSGFVYSTVRYRSRSSKYFESTKMHRNQIGWLNEQLFGATLYTSMPMLYVL